MISDHFTSITNPTLTEIACMFDNAFGGYFTFIILLALGFVLAFGIMVWNTQDNIGSFLYGFSTVTSVGFLLTLIGGRNCDQLLGFNQFIWLLMITVILFIAKKMDG